MKLDIVEDEGLLFKEHLSQNELKKSFNTIFMI